jgi:mono/diheme cytochrome c family protein
LLDVSAWEATVDRRFLAHRLLFAWLLAIVGLCGIAVTRITSAASAQLFTPVGPPFAFHAIRGAQKLPWPNVGEDPIVTPVAGPSWLTHLGIGLRQTNLGQGAERYGPAPDQDRTARNESLSVPGTLRINGADLYRLNCQACHRAEGICHDAVGPRPSESALLRGAVPSLGSLLKIKSISEFVHKARKGEVVSYGDAWLRHRGRMPVFYYLRDEEVASAYVYLATYPPQPARP